MTKDKENLYEMEIALCNLVSIAENAVGKEEFEKLDNAGAEIIECLAELERYKAIGTVERFEQLSKQFAPHNVDETSCHLRQCNKCDMYRKENEKYHEIGTIENFKALKEKATPKEPIIIDNRLNEVEWKCPVCGLNVIEEPPCQEYCQRCGNKLDWSE